METEYEEKWVTGRYGQRFKINVPKTIIKEETIMEEAVQNAINVMAGNGIDSQEVAKMEANTTINTQELLKALKKNEQTDIYGIEDLAVKDAMNMGVMSIVDMKILDKCKDGNTYYKIIVNVNDKKYQIDGERAKNDIAVRVRTAKEFGISVKDLLKAIPTTLRITKQLKQGCEGQAFTDFSGDDQINNWFYNFIVRE